MSSSVPHLIYKIGPLWQQGKLQMQTQALFATQNFPIHKVCTSLIFLPAASPHAVAVGLLFICRKE